MAKVISKTLRLTTIKYSKVVVENGTATIVAMPDKHFMGDMPHARASRIISKEMGDIAFVITDIVVATNKYEMSIDDFVNGAVKLNEDGSPIEEAKDKNVYITEELAETERGGSALNTTPYSAGATGATNS